MGEDSESASGPAARRALIVGGGIGGLSAAIALAGRGIEVTAVERAEGSVGASIGFSYRSVHALAELGILDEVIARGRQYPLDGPPFWSDVFRPDGERLPVTVPTLDADWEFPSTVVIYRPVLSQIMVAAARECGAEVLFGHSYRSISQQPDYVEVELTTGARERFDLVVAADGVASELRGRFFPEIEGPHYTGSMSFRMMFADAPDAWRGGLHVANGTTIASAMLADNLFYLALPNHMERRHLDQDEAREIVRSVLADFRPSEMFDQICERLTDEINVIIAPYEWVFIDPPWHRGRVALLGDAVHATAPTIGAAGGMAVEDGVVLGQELGATADLDVALTAYAQRREERAKLVVETSAELMHTHQLRRPLQEESKMRLDALQKLAEAY